MRVDPRFLTESGTEIFNGSELILKGCLETPGGVALLTGYPGSPLAGFFDSMQDCGELLREKGVAGKMANNEALSVAMVNGAQMIGVKAISVFKSVGLHVAADALALGNLAGVPVVHTGLCLSVPNSVAGSRGQCVLMGSRGILSERFANYLHRRSER